MKKTEQKNQRLKKNELTRNELARNELARNDITKNDITKNDLKKQEEIKNRFALTILFALITFGILLVSVVVAALAVYIFSVLKIRPVSTGTEPVLGGILWFMSLVSLVVGTGLAMIVIKLPLRPVNQMITQMNRLASGDFKARLQFGKHIGTHPSFAEAAESFNKMAEELESTELLRSDFIDNFSHEFKTPIVSIAGFAKLLKRENLTDEQRTEYINVIEEEALRLANMATNVLYLTKVENQTILTDVTEFNLSEQIRSAVLLLESKWMRKNLDFYLEFREYTITANEEMLKQVWINLIDNAIKFSPDYGTVEVSIDETDGGLEICVINSGDIPERKQAKIWNKFYQADESHSFEGNGIGLAIVRRAVELHKGCATVKSEKGIVKFTVKLPGGKRAEQIM